RKPCRAEGRLPRYQRKQLWDYLYSPASLRARSCDRSGQRPDLQLRAGSLHRELYRQLSQLDLGKPIWFQRQYHGPSGSVFPEEGSQKYPRTVSMGPQSDSAGRLGTFRIQRRWRRDLGYGWPDLQLRAEAFSSHGQALREVWRQVWVQRGFP